VISDVLSTPDVLNLMASRYETLHSRYKKTPLASFCLTFHFTSSKLRFMLARVFSCAVIRLEGVIVEVEVDYSNGLPAVIIVGLPDSAVQESRERVQTAVKNAGLNFPRHRVVVNLAPAAVRKEGPAYDFGVSRWGTVDPDQ
jgi:hypothetical protein